MPSLRCGICLDACAADSACPPPCGRGPPDAVFHGQCLAQWRERSGRCPHCNQEERLSAALHRVLGAWLRGAAPSRPVFVAAACAQLRGGPERRAERDARRAVLTALRAAHDVRVARVSATTVRFTAAPHDATAPRVAVSLKRTALWSRGRVRSDGFELHLRSRRPQQSTAAS